MKKRFNNLKKQHFSDKETFKKITEGKEFAIYKTIINDEFVLYDKKLDESFSIGNDSEFLEVYRIIKIALELEEMEIGQSK